MPLSLKEDLPILLGVATATLVTGGLIGYFLGKTKEHETELTIKKDSGEEPKALIQKAYQKKEDVVGKTIDDYIIEHSLREPTMLEELRKVTIESLPNHMMLSDQVEGQLIRMLLNIVGAEKCIEIGTYTGYNALNMALCIPSNGKVIACDVTDEYLKYGMPFIEKAGLSDKIDFHIRPALETLEELISKGESGTFDFAFIDADKSGYDSYYEACLLLVRKGGLIIIDNTLWSGLVVGGDEKIALIKEERKRESTTHIHNLNKKLKSDDRIQLSFLKIADGVTIARKL